MANSDLGQFEPRPLVNSDPIKTRSELTNAFLKIGSELAKVPIDFRSDSTCYILIVLINFFSKFILPE